MAETAAPGRVTPSPPASSDERRLVTGALVAVALAAVPLVGGAALVAGRPGAAGALVGVGLVGLLFAGSAALLRPAARLRPAGAVAVLVGGAFGRMLLYLVVLGALAQLAWVHRPSLAAATAAALAITLAWELRLLTRMPRLFWIDAGRRPAFANVTRSRTS